MGSEKFSLEQIGNRLYVKMDMYNKQPAYQKVIKGWRSYNGELWLAIENNGAGGWFGLVQGQEDEMQNFKESELKDLLMEEIPKGELPYSGKRIPAENREKSEKINEKYLI